MSAYVLYMVVFKKEKHNTVNDDCSKSWITDILRFRHPGRMHFFQSQKENMSGNKRLYGLIHVNDGFTITVSLLFTIIIIIITVYTMYRTQNWLQFTCVIITEVTCKLTRNMFIYMVVAWRNLCVHPLSLSSSHASRHKEWIGDLWKWAWGNTQHKAIVCGCVFKLSCSLTPTRLHKQN